jgi:hypothetical protein
MNKRSIHKISKWVEIIIIIIFTAIVIAHLILGSMVPPQYWINH